MLATAPVLAGLALPIRYRGDSGLVLVEEAGAAAGAAGSAGAGLLATTHPGSGDETALLKEQARVTERNHKIFEE